jgi:hypothetical protein
MTTGAEILFGVRAVARAFRPNAIGMIVADIVRSVGKPANRRRRVIANIGHS